MTDIDIQGELRVHLSSLERKRDQQRASLKSLLWHLADKDRQRGFTLCLNLRD